jgi:hypothetical protein
MRGVLSKKQPIFHIFKSAEVAEAVRLGVTPTLIIEINTVWYNDILRIPYLNSFSKFKIAMASVV